MLAVARVLLVDTPVEVGLEDAGKKKKKKYIFSLFLKK